MSKHLDVLIVGAGLSGIGAAYHLQRDCPGKTYAILEARQAIGGTWDLFRYPGIRSDSDMYTLGYNFKPWTNPKAIADGPSIRDYIRETARENGIDRHIRYGHKILKSSWSTADALWTVDVQHVDSGKTEQLTCNFLWMCTGYYKYDKGYTPDFAGRDSFKGTIIHPQHWPENLDYSGKKVVIIGSGATAVTLVPAMTDKAAHVTMLQRSPTYIATIPEKDPIATNLRRFLPEKMVYRITRAKNVSLTLGFFNLAKKRPAPVRRLLLGMVKRQLKGSVDMKHFTPSYNPWDERLCAVPDGDLFKVLRQGKASVVTDHIDRFDETGIKLKSGQHLEADIIITATGLDLQILGGMTVEKDGQPFDMTSVMNYKGIMFENLPNLAMIFGYTNASWTLKADISSEYICRLLNHMDKTGRKIATPMNTDPTVEKESFVEMHSGYIQRALSKLPKQGNKAPWKVYMNYMLDLGILRYKPIDDGVMRFSSPSGATAKVRKAA